MSLPSKYTNIVFLIKESVKNTENNILFCKSIAELFYICSRFKRISIMIGVDLKYRVIKELITSFFCILSLLSLSAQDSYSSRNGDAPKALESLSANGGNYVETAMGLNLRMVFVDGGTFQMGATAEQAKDASTHERPVREITMSPYYIGMFEITQEQWQKVMGTTVGELGHDMRGIGADFPMYYVNWDDAMEFCRKLSEQSGKTYTLPTEAQWEYAARGGANSKNTKYSGSPYANAVLG